MDLVDVVKQVIGFLYLAHQELAVQEVIVEEIFHLMNIAKGFPCLPLYC